MVVTTLPVTIQNAQYDTAKRIIVRLEAHKVRGGFDDGAAKVVHEALIHAFEDGARHGKTETLSEQERTYQRNLWDERLNRRIGAFVAAVGEQVTMPALMRAAEVAPAVDPPSEDHVRRSGAQYAPLDVARWAETVVDKLRTGSPDDAHDIVRSLRAATTTPGPSTRTVVQRRSDMDLVVAFVAGGLLF